MHNQPLIRIFAALAFLAILQGCAVVKTPYIRTDYYAETIDRLEQVEPDTTEVDCQLLAGFSKRYLIPDMQVISPAGNKQIPIAGYGQLKTKYAEGIHDSIFVRAIALKSGTQLRIIISAEMLIIPPNIADSVITRLGRQGIAREQLFFAATHTHSGIGGWGYGFLAKLMAGKRNEDIEEWLTSRLTLAATDAIRDLQPAGCATASFDAPGFMRNRLTGIPEHNNTSFDYLLFEQSSGRKAIIGIYSAHATTSSGKNRLISGDYPGYWSGSIESSGYYLGMFCAGSMSGQSPAGKGDEFESAAYIGTSLADSVLKRVVNLEPGMKPVINSVSLKTELPDYHFRMTANRNFSTRFSERLMPAPEYVYLQALRIDKLIWFFTPGDFNGESANLLKKILRGKGYESVVSGYNGSYIGYILPGKYYYLDHYEARTMSWFGPTLGDYINDQMERLSNILTR